MKSEKLTSKKSRSLCSRDFILVDRKGLTSLEPPDKQWVTTGYPMGNLQANFLLIRVLQILDT